MKSTKARGFGKQYVQLLWGWRGPQREAGWTNETEAPYRYGHATVRRVGRSRLAVVHGHWVGQHPGPAQLHALVGAYEMVDEENELDLAPLRLLLQPVELW